MRVDLISRDCELEISKILLMVDPRCDASTPGCLVDNPSTREILVDVG